MCGFVSLFSRPSVAASVAVLEPALVRMANRGPDASGVWAEEECAFGHRRLAILDLDDRATQPMQSICGRYVIVFNGEIYNFAALRAELEVTGVQFRTSSDTEVVLALFAAEQEAMLPRLRGMFAFTIWDRIAKKGFAARDPYGIKPLYVADTEQGVLLGSQVRALLVTSIVPKTPCYQGQAGFWQLGSVPEPFTWFESIRAFPAGHYAWIEQGSMRLPQKWWDISDAWRSALPVPGSNCEVTERVREALMESVEAHLVADVPVGVFLSGGIDSGALAGLMTDAGASNIQGITLTYDEFFGSCDDEAPAAALLAAHYGIRHHVRRVTREEFQSDLPRILEAMDQPSIDGINTWYASKAAAELGLKVVISGVGGDELFQGYDSFHQLPRLVRGWNLASKVPGAMALANWVGSLQARRTGNGRWRHLPDWLRTIGGAWWLRRCVLSPTEVHERMGGDTSDVMKDFSPAAKVQEMSGILSSDLRLALGQIESSTYLRNQLLRDSDWASMDHAVELRTPLVDAWLLRDLKPLLGQFERFPNKRLLAEAPVRPLPKTVSQRKKTGFSIPIHGWLQDLSMTERGYRAIPGWALTLSRAYDLGVK
jgi:asparagine synthase (glutamine-hydrolysing)